MATMEDYIDFALWLLEDMRRIMTSISIKKLMVKDATAQIEECKRREHDIIVLSKRAITKHSDPDAFDMESIKNSLTTIAVAEGSSNACEEILSTIAKKDVDDWLEIFQRDVRQLVFNVIKIQPNIAELSQISNK